MGIVKKACGILGGSTTKKMSKLKTLLHLTVCRLAVLKSQHNARCGHARDDLLQLIQLGHLDRALLRAEHVIKEENILDVFAMLEAYCHLLTERSVLLRGKNVCPGELREAVSSLIYASSRMGNLPELYHVRRVFSSMFGKDFTSSAAEIRNGCGVNPKIVQNLSTRQPSLETRVRITKEIAAAKGITLDLVCNETATSPNNDHAITKPTMQANTNSTPIMTDSSRTVSHKYKDAASAAQAALESAEDAAAAAKAAVELSRPSQPSSDDCSRTVDDNASESKEVAVEVNKSESSNGSDTSEGEDDIEMYFSSARLFPDDERMKRPPYTFRSNSTGSPLNEEEDTFELASLKKSEIELEKPSLRNWVSDAASDSDLSDQQADSLWQKNIISGRKNRVQFREQKYRFFRN